MYVQVILCTVKLAEWPPSWKELITLLNVCSLCHMFI